MNRRIPRFTVKGTYATWTLAALAVLLPALLAPSAAPRAALAGARSVVPPMAARVAGALKDPADGDTYVPWDEGDELSQDIQIFRGTHGISAGRNVAAFRLNMKSGHKIVVVAASAGNRVKGVDRQAIYNVYIDGKPANPPVFALNLFLKDKTENGGNFDSEMLIIRYLEARNLGPEDIESIDVRTELMTCARCASRIESTYDGKIPVNVEYNFPRPSPETEAIEKQNLPPDAKRAALQKEALRQMKSVIGKWIRAGMAVKGQSDPLSKGLSRQASRKINAMLANLGDFAVDCLKNNQPTGKPDGNQGQAMALGAMSSAVDCPEGEGTPGGLVQALESSDLGGVDFSTLQMRYMSDDPGSGGLRYSFSGRPVTSRNRQDIAAALDGLTNSTADLRTWLVLSPDTFWVNLNPTEPDRIVDPKVGQTNAGKAMLDADLQMKTTSAKLLDPRTKLGAQYWRALSGSAAQACYESRMWIVPGDVEIHQDGGSLYILKAQLAVKAVPEHVTSSQSCHYTPETDARGRRLDDTLIVPRITKAVNTAPEYAPIRRAFMARVVAQWIRDRHASGQRTSFDSLIDSGNVGPARLTDGWQPRQVFDDYVHLFNGGAFTYTTTVHEGRTIVTQKITVGGVDFSKLSPTKVSAAQMDRQIPNLPQTATASAKGLALTSDGSMWLGGTIPAPSVSLWSKLTDPVRTFASGRAGVAILLLAALGVVTFGIRRGSRHRRQAS